MSAPPPRRRNIRLPEKHYLGQRAYFVTICSAKRKRLFLDAARAQWTLARLREIAAARPFAVHSYCLMPDHLHLLVRGLSASSDLLSFVHRFKSATAQDEKQATGRALWQRYFYDHILRPRDSGIAVAWYIWLNPVRAGLCRTPEEYPLSGSFTGEWPVRKRTIIAWMPPWKTKGRAG